MFTYILPILLIAFIIYEISLHQSYKKELQNEKLIAEFSFMRMQIMKMLYYNETSKDSFFFRFMLPATSYSIRALYYNKKTYYLTNDTFIDNMIDLLKNVNMKEEFRNLDTEQKRMFGNTIVMLLELYLNDNMLDKILFKIYFLKLKVRVLKGILRLLGSLQPETKKKIENINDINNIYGISSVYDIPAYSY